MGYISSIIYLLTYLPKHDQNVHESNTKYETIAAGRLISIHAGRMSSSISSIDDFDLVVTIDPRPEKTYYKRDPQWISSCGTDLGRAVLLLKPRPHQQQCRSNIVECYKSNIASTLLSFLATMLPVSATMSNEISSFRQSRNKLNTFNLFRLCRKNRSTCSIRQCSFDIVAGVDGALFSWVPGSIILLRTNATVDII